MNKPTIIGWIAITLSTLLSCLWAFWGVFESFHEGWYFQSPIENLMLTMKYLTLMAVLTALSIIALRWPGAGGVLYGLFGIGFFAWLCLTRKTSGLAVILGWLPMILPLVMVGILFWCGRPAPSKRVYQICIVLPVLVGITTGVEPAWRIAGRIDDGDRGMRYVEGNGTGMIWAPEGPGWPNPNPRDQTWRAEWSGPTWEEARQSCRNLARDGKSLGRTPQDIWRLPTTEEVVRSMARHGKNSGGVWDPASGRASYATRPDKETPLWNPYSPVIYWWTATECGDGRAYVISHEGMVFCRAKDRRMGSQGFRAVRLP